MADPGMNVPGNIASKGMTPKSLITEEIVQSVLTADKGANACLTAWKIVDFVKKGDNYACVVTSIEVEYKQAGQNFEASYVAKLNPQVNIPQVAFMNELIFEKEIKFYLELAPELNSMLKETGQREINIPKCYRANLEKGKEIIILEDLRKRGYKMLDRKSGMDEAHTTLVLREMARLHAASLLLQNKYQGQALDEKYPHLEKDMNFLISNSTSAFMMFKNGVTFAQQILKKVGGYERAIVWIDTLIPKLAQVFYEQTKTGKWKVVCHGDCWSNNILFKYNKDGHPEDAMLLDLQVVRYGSLTSELNFLLFASTVGDVRKSNLQAFLNSYHKTFTDIMEAAGEKTPFTQEELLKDYRDKNLFGGICGMMALPIVMFQGGDEADSSEDSGESALEKIAKVRAKAMATLDTNPLLKPRFLSLFDEMMENGIIP